MTDRLSRPKISVMIPVYNGELFLAEAIRSVLAQTLPPDEIIVVDDGSTDASAEIVRSFSRVQLVRREHSGLAATLNAGVRQAAGAYLAFLDADDRWLPEKLALQVAAFTQERSLDMVFGYGRRFRVVEAEGLYREDALDVLPGVAKSGLLVTRSAFKRVGWFIESPEEHDFLNWYARACAAGLNMQILPQVIFERRIHEANMGVVAPQKQHRSYLKSLRAKIHQARQGSDRGTGPDRSGSSGILA